MSIQENSHILGVDIGGTKTSVTLWNTGCVTENNLRLDAERIATGGSPGYMLDLIIEKARGLLARHGVTEKQVSGTGISCGGPLDASRGIVLSPPNLPGWDAVPVAETLRKAFGAPAYLENDANACALAEWKWGAGRGYHNVVFLTFGTGMGAGLILDDTLYRGTTGLAGEIGHVRIAPGGPEGYGKRGSFEGFCSGAGLHDAYRSLTGVGKDAKQICDLARAGEPAARTVIEESAVHLGRGLAVIIDILNPDCIVLGSIFERNQDLFMHGMERSLQEEALACSWQACAIRPSELGDAIGDWAALGVVLARKKESA